MFTLSDLSGTPVSHEALTAVSEQSRDRLTLVSDSDTKERVNAA